MSHIPLPTRIREMIGHPSYEGTVVHPENSIVVRDRIEAVKGLCEAMYFDTEAWGDLTPRRRWAVANRLLDLDWRRRNGRIKAVQR